MSEKNIDYKQDYLNLLKRYNELLAVKDKYFDTIKELKKQGAAGKND